jgi:uncharacterized protein
LWVWVQCVCARQLPKSEPIVLCYGQYPRTFLSYINAKEPPLSKALLKAASNGNIATLTALINAGENLEFADKGTGRTALIEATLANQEAAVDLLLANGANVNVACKAMGYSPLAWAAYNNQLNLLTKLLAAGANVQFTTHKFSITPLMVAAQAGHTAALQRLVDYGADIHALTPQHRNALSMAQENNQTEVAALLIMMGATLPVLPHETVLPWPSLTNAPDALDKTDPITVLYGFITGMNQWETACEQQRQHVGAEKLDWQAIMQAQTHITDCFCTPTFAEKHGGGSFSSLPLYTPQLMLCEASIKNKHAKLLVRQPAGEPLRYEYLYTLTNDGHAWLIDNKQSRAMGTEKWAKSYL